MGATIELINVTNYALREVHLRVGKGDLLTILGPNGSGKTTLMKVIAGLVPYMGSVWMDGRPVDGVPPSSRGIGYAPQDLGLIPTMTILDNVALPLRARGMKIDEARREAMRTLADLCLEHLASRYPLRVSGGERRLAVVARAISGGPEIVLLDEPTSGLQPSRAREMAKLIVELWRSGDYTVIFVTHDIETAATINSPIALMLSGRIIAKGSLYDTVKAASREYSSYTGLNLLACKRIDESSYGLAVYDCGGVKLVSPDGGPNSILAFSPDDVVQGSGPNSLEGEVVDCSDGTSLLAMGQLHIVARLRPCPPRGSRVVVSIPLYSIRTHPG